MTIGLVIFWLMVLVLILFCLLIREYLYFKNYISELEKRNQKPQKASEGGFDGYPDNLPGQMEMSDYAV